MGIFSTLDEYNFNNASNSGIGMIPPSLYDNIMYVEFVFDIKSVSAFLAFFLLL